MQQMCFEWWRDRRSSNTEDLNKLLKDGWKVFLTATPSNPSSDDCVVRYLLVFLQKEAEGERFNR